MKIIHRILWGKNELNENCMRMSVVKERKKKLDNRTHYWNIFWVFHVLPFCKIASIARWSRLKKKKKKTMHRIKLHKIHKYSTQTIARLHMTFNFFPLLLLFLKINKNPLMYSFFEFQHMAIIFIGELLHISFSIFFKNAIFSLHSK